MLDWTLMMDVVPTTTIVALIDIEVARTVKQYKP